MTNPKAIFNYEVPGPKFTVRVLDTRTRRTYKTKGSTPPRLLGDSMDAQLPAGPFGDGRELLVVISAAPVLFPRIFESVAAAALAPWSSTSRRICSGARTTPCPGKVTGLSGSEAKDVEGWRADEGHHEQFLRRLGTYRRVVVALRRRALRQHA